MNPCTFDLIIVILYSIYFN